MKKKYCLIFYLFCFSILSFSEYKVIDKNKENLCYRVYKTFEKPNNTEIITCLRIYDGLYDIIIIGGEPFNINEIGIKFDDNEIIAYSSDEIVDYYFFDGEEADFFISEMKNRDYLYVLIEETAYRVDLKDFEKDLKKIRSNILK